MTHDARMAKVANEYYEVDNRIKAREKALKAEMDTDIKRREELKGMIYEETGKVSKLLGKIFFLFSETVSAKVAKSVSDRWTEEQWELFYSLGGTREATRTLKSVTKRA